MHKPTDIGPNRTGIATAAVAGKRVDGVEARTRGGPDAEALEIERVRWSTEAPPVGTMPPSGPAEGALATIMEKVGRRTATVFIDKLGERLAFERTGARLYDALLAKFEAAHVHDGGPTRRQLERLRDDEIRHFAIVRDAMIQLGADATAMTPSADVVGVAAHGWVQVLTDPRSTLSQCLGVMLSVEVTDGEGWELLVTLSESLGFQQIARQFRIALIEQEQHASQVRTWLTSTLLGQAGVHSTPPAQDQSGI